MNTPRLAIPPPRDERPSQRAWLFHRCWRGQEPLEALVVAGFRDERDFIIRELVRAGWTDAQIAAHTKHSSYTIGRLRGRLGIHPNINVTTRGAA